MKVYNQLIITGLAWLGLALVIWMVFPSLNFFDQSFFTFHDITQVGRVTSFTHNLQAGNVPPRIAPEYSFQLGFPVFNFYAPTAYWITSIFTLLGISSVLAVKISFLLAVVTAYLGMVFFLQKLYAQSAAVLGGVVYVTSTYWATEIMVRGNLAEVWFLALLPVSLGLLIQNTRNTQWTIFPTVIVWALLFTSHNMLSLFGIALVAVSTLFFENRFKNFLTFLLALLVDSYFLLPAFLESNWVQATTVAMEYPYGQHFLCLNQLWSAVGWQFGGSLPGCADTMSFKLGKLQLLLAAFGGALLVLQVLVKKEYTRKSWFTIFIAIVTLGSMFLSMGYSKFFWDLFSEAMALFQFPWRFLAFAMFGVAVLAGYALTIVPNRLKIFLLVICMGLLFYPAQKYFIKPLIPLAEYEQTYNSTEYLETELAYKMKEYLAAGADYNRWSSFNQTSKELLNLGFAYDLPVEFTGAHSVLLNQSFIQKVAVAEAGSVYVNKHYFPLWKLYVNGEEVEPTKFDQLARPILQVSAGDEVVIKYQQTTLERIANIVSIAALVSAGLLPFSQFHWLSINARRRN